MAALAPAVWVPVVGSLLTLAGIVYNARRAARSSDRAQQVALQTKQVEAAAAADGAENSAYTRAQEMIAAAARVQQENFDRVVESMTTRMASLEKQVDEQRRQLDAQHDQIVNLQRSRDRDRREYTRYIQKLLDLLEHHKIVYPAPPPFFDESP